MSRATPPTAHLHFRLTLLPELRACASSATNFHLFWGKFLFLLCPFDDIPCVWSIIWLNKEPDRSFNFLFSVQRQRRRQLVSLVVLYGRTNFSVSFNSLHVIFSSEALKCLACWVSYKDTMRANQLFSCFPPVDFRDAGTTSCVLKNGRQELIRHKREFLSEKSFNGTWNGLWATWWEARSWINLV